MERNLKADLRIIKTPSDLFYFTGYDNADAVLIYTSNGAYYFTDSRYFEEAEVLKKDFELKSISDLDDFLADSDYKTAEIESGVDVAFLRRIEKHGIKATEYCDEEIARLRAVKSPSEIEKIKKAQEITDKTFSQVLNGIREGMTERELAAELESLLFSNGGDDLAFKSIVAFGENTSKPHAHRTDKKLEKGMAITMDFGAKFGGYCSDMTRTVFFGEPDGELKKLYNIVLAAQEKALNEIRPGMTGRDCDKIARDYFKTLRLDGYFIHSLGHGLGIDIHENPTFSPRCNEIMKKGMVLSVEPGLYFKGKYGVRIEDIIYFDEHSIINLTKSPKSMIIL